MSTHSFPIKHTLAGKVSQSGWAPRWEFFPCLLQHLETSLSPSNPSWLYCPCAETHTCRASGFLRSTPS